MEETLVVYTTWPDADTAGAAARAAVEAGAAACANILAPMTSVYRWEGKLEQATEIPVLFKTTAAAAGRLRDLILACHPYDTPAILALETKKAGSNPAFLQWISMETR
jgi:periplasmic divalent cation tolerance protein